MKSKLFVPSMLFTLAILCAFAISHSFAIEPTIENAVFNGNWEEVVNALEKDDSQANDPVSRLIMAHASLATNRNNAAMMLFLSVKEEVDVTSWSDWTSSLLNKNPENPVTLYLHADAQARSGNHNEAAVQLLTKALNLPSSPLSQNSSAREIDSSEMVNYALICNARGVLRMLTNDMDYALMDFLQATRLAPNLADAHANLGSYYIMTEAADGALEECNKAIGINPEFALAYNGMGCAYFGNGRFEEASQSFSMAFQLCPILAIAEINQGFASAYSSKLLTVAEKITENPGTTFTSISKQYPEILKEQNQQLLKTLPSRSDHEFWGKINNVSSLSDSQYQSLVKEYGSQKVQMGTFLKMQELRGQIAGNYQNKTSVSDKIDFSGRVASLSLSNLNSTKESLPGWRNILNQPTNRTNITDVEKIISSNLTKGTSNQKFLVDIPGVGWTGEARENDWGNMLRADKVTIYIRHEGPGIDKWSPPKEANAIIVTLPNKFDENIAGKLLLPHVNVAFSQGKDIHFIVDKNITFERHVTVPKPEEDIWAANVTDYITSQKPANCRGILAEHSRGTVSNAYIKNFSPFERIIVSSPRGDDALSWIHRTPNLPPTDIITGLSDAPNWRWTERYGTLLKENPNIRIVQLQNIADLATTHSRLQNLETNGNWKIITGNGSQDFKGNLGDIVTPQSTKSLFSTNGASYAQMGVKYRAFEHTFNRLNELKTSNLKAQPSSPIPGYFTATDRPITEVGALASMVDKGIKTGSSARSALIVSQDTFRTNLLQSELSKYGFQTKVIPPGTDPQAAARQWGADVILGVKGNSGMKFAQKTSIPIENPLPKYSGKDNYRKVQLLLPPDNGGGGGGIANQNWDWGKQFTPTYSKGLPPGGVSTEEIAKAFVDKGNWPVLTTFSLFYK